MMRSTASSSVSSVMRTAKKESGPKIARTTCFWSVPSSSGQKTVMYPGQAKRLRDGDKLVRKKIIRPGQLHVPAFVEQPALDQLGDVRASLQPDGRRGMAEAEDALFFRAVLAMSGCGARTMLRIDGALDDSRGDGGVRERIDDDEAAGDAIQMIRIEKQRQRGLHVHRGNFVQIELRGRHDARAC